MATFQPIPADLLTKLRLVKLAQMRPFSKRDIEIIRAVTPLLREHEEKNHGG